MVDIGDPFVVLSLVVGIIAGIGIPAIYAMTRQRDLTLKGSLRLETYNEDLSEVRADIKTIITKLDEITRKLDNHEYRLSQVEKELIIIREKKIGALQQELMEVHNHKSRITYLEQEIKELKEQRQRYRNGGEKSAI